jgi:hypothetical protein
MRTKLSSYLLLPAAAGILFFASCAAPRTVYHSGKVTPEGQLVGGIDLTGNVATATVKEIFDNADLVEAFVTRDSVKYNNADSIIIDNMSRSVLAYTLDPVGTGYDIYLRYGIVKRLDVGYKLAGGTHVFDTRFQFLGSTGTPSDPGDDPKKLSGSIGLQFSTRSYELPSIFSLGDIQDLLGFEMKRTDFLVPLSFSVPFGDEESYGCLSFGMAYGHTLLKYKIDPTKIYEYTQNNVPQVIPAVDEKKSYSSFGGFINIKGGYKFVYLLGSLAIYHQNYGTFPMLKGKTVELKGTTFVPSIGLQLNFMELANEFKK